MNPDELPERNIVQVSYGDHHYRFVLQGPFISSDNLRLQVLSHMNKGLSQFHMRVSDMSRELARVTGLLYESLGRVDGAHGDLEHKLHKRRDVTLINRS